MANFRTTADYVDAVLLRAGESTSGTSQYEADALFYLNKIHSSLIGGGLIFDVDVNEDWVWARVKRPYTLQLDPAHTTGTITLTEGSDAGSFSSAPAASLKYWHLRVTGENTVYRIVKHTAGETSFEIDAFYIGDTGSGKNYTAFKLDYAIVPSHIYISDHNDKIDFVRSGTTEVTVTLAHGSYTTTALATEVASKIQAGAGGTSTYGCTYDSITRKFTLTSNRQGGDVFYLLGSTGTNTGRSALPSLGFDDVDGTNAASHVSTYVLGGVSRLIAPIRAYHTSAQCPDIEGIDLRTMQENYPTVQAGESIPNRFTVIQESEDGCLTMRLNSYPSEKMKVEVEVIPIPRDLKDNTASVPLVPRKFSDILEYGAAYFILLDKEDDKAQQYAALAQQQLKLMQKQHRSQAERISSTFGEIIPRRDLLGSSRRLRYGYDADDR